MANIVHKIHIKQPAQKVYDAIATMEGLKGWWTEHVDGESKEGSALVFKFPDSGPNMEVLELSPPESIKWKCIDEDGEWKDTIFTFEIEEKGGESELLFAQSGWEDETDLFAHCNMKWAVFMLSLKHYCEDGKGEPFPNDVKIEQ